MQFGRSNCCYNINRGKSMGPTNLVWYRSKTLAMVAISSTALMLGAPSAYAAPTVITAQGTLRGLVAETAEAFFAVPYATPPLGILRFQPSQPPQPYPGGVRDATSLPPPCYQAGAATATAPAPSEDCLYLNLWRPAGTLPNQKLPVLVYFHGGGLRLGDSNSQSPIPMVTTTPMIVVYPHYRLGAFGWLALPALDKESADDEETADGMSSGNYGFLDVVQSLRWVKENIAAFGGDPDAVTIGGASSGGQLVCIALTAPLKEKLFHRAIIQSGECAPSSTADRGSTQPAARAFMVTHQQELLSGIPFAVKLGCSDPETFAACLRAVSASALFAGGLTPHPNVGGALMPAFFFDAIRSRHIAKVPVLLGVSHDELRSFPLPTTGFPGTVDGYHNFMTATFGTLASIVEAMYPVTSYSAPAYAAGAALSDSGAALSDLGIPSGIGVCSMLFEQADPLSEVTPTYAYEFDDPNASGGGAIPAGFVPGSQHGSEGRFLYSNISLPGAIRPDEQVMAYSMLRYWGSFIASGHPSDGVLPWPRYDPTAQSVMRFQPNGNLVLPRGLVSNEHNCDFWLGLGY